MKFSALFFFVVASLQLSCGDENKNNNDDEYPIDNSCISHEDCTDETPYCVSSCYDANPPENCPHLQLVGLEKETSPGICMFVEECNNTDEPIQVHVEFTDQSEIYKGSFCAGPQEYYQYHIKTDEYRPIRFHLKITDFGEIIGTDKDIGFSLSYSDTDYGFVSLGIDKQRTDYYGILYPNPDGLIEVGSYLLLNTAKIRKFELSFRDYKNCSEQAECSTGFCVDYVCAMCKTHDDCSEERPVCRNADSLVNGPKDCYPK